MSDPQPAPVQLRDLSIGYRRDLPILRGLTLDVVPGEVLAIVGPNGSGKTTLFRTLLGVLPPLGGEVSVSGLVPADYRRRHGLGYLAEDTAMPGGWSCDGILAVAAAAAGPDADVENALRLAGVDYATDVPARKLSKGMKRRLALAVALMRPIRLLILDEPESGLDPGQRHRLRRRIETIRSTMTILVAAARRRPPCCQSRTPRAAARRWTPWALNGRGGSCEAEPRSRHTSRLHSVT